MRWRNATFSWVFQSLQEMTLDFECHETLGSSQWTSPVSLLFSSREHSFRIYFWLLQTEDYNIQKETDVSIRSLMSEIQMHLISIKILPLKDVFFFLSGPCCSTSNRINLYYYSFIKYTILLICFWRPRRKCDFQDDESINYPSYVSRTPQYKLYKSTSLF